ncbi:hypothetical protein HDU81_007362 [Chytriomyces hyalinus]|nr:hypothetical protein HDU81_007362 [Chytriomyces hyalinus]
MKHKVAILAFLSDEGISRASGRALKRVYIEALSQFEIAIVTDATSFKAVERWNGSNSIRILNIGAKKDFRLADTMDLLLHHSFITDAQSITIIPVQELREISWSLVEFCLTSDHETPFWIQNANPEKLDVHSVFAFRASKAAMDSMRMNLTEMYTDLNSTKSVVQLYANADDASTWETLVRNIGDIEIMNIDNLRLRVSLTAASSEALAQTCDPIIAHSHARVGLIGNPSDGFFGKTISLLIKNFHATVTLTPNASATDQIVRIDRTPELDPYQFASIETLHSACEKDGYYGVQRLMLAGLNVFTGYCEKNGVDLSFLRGFTVVYETNIPRQVGLAGSSALITALIKALVIYYRLGRHPAFEPHLRANLALAAEKEALNISAGLQDRVIQAYGGLVFMDFNRAQMDAHGYGVYERLPLELVPKGLWIAYVGCPSDSGSIHNNVRARFEKGDPEVHEAMTLFANLAVEAKSALTKSDTATLARLMDTNFATRRRIYGDAVIGAENLAVVEIAHAFGHATKFSGSGGCVVGLWKGGDEEEKLERRREMKRRIREVGYVFEEVVPAGGGEESE